VSAEAQACGAVTSERTHVLRRLIRNRADLVAICDIFPHFNVHDVNTSTQLAELTRQLEGVGLGDALKSTLILAQGWRKQGMTRKVMQKSHYVISTHETPSSGTWQWTLGQQQVGLVSSQSFTRTAAADHNHITEAYLSNLCTTHSDVDLRISILLFLVCDSGQEMKRICRALIRTFSYSLVSEFLYKVVFILRCINECPPKNFPGNQISSRRAQPLSSPILYTDIMDTALLQSPEGESLRHLYFNFEHMIAYFEHYERARLRCRLSNFYTAMARKFKLCETLTSEQWQVVLHNPQVGDVSDMCVVLYCLH
jgi:hypothetical protein